MIKDLFSRRSPALFVWNVENTKAGFFLLYFEHEPGIKRPAF
jgi:hypothetical protein